VAGFDAGDVGENDEQVGVESLGQEAGGGALVHDGFDAFELTQPVADDRGAASPGADHHDARVEEPRMSRVSTTRRGIGEGTTRRQAPPSALTVQPRSAAIRWALAAG
jgi:hypothetical protein